MFSTANRGTNAAPGVIASSFKSTLFSALFDFESLAEGQSLTVLDLGPAISVSVAFFGQYKCRLHILDLFSEPFLAQQQALTDDELNNQLRGIFDFSKNTRFDVCLFWDLFNYLDKPAILALNHLLAPFLHLGTKAHCFGLLKANTRLSYQQYGILQPDSLKVAGRPDPAPVLYHHPQAELKGLLSSFNVSRTMLLGDGRLEMLLQSRVEELSD